MPFTLSHPAAVLPIHSRCKKWISLSSLVVGSLVPDAGYYLPMPDRYKENAHTWFGALTFSLPLGIVVLVVFYWFAREIVFLLPSPHREALQPKLRVPTVSLREALMAACGIVLGAETHVLWDSFTHGTGWLVARVPFLREPLIGDRLPVYFVLQVLSSIVGLWILLHVYDRWMAAAGFRPWTWQRPFWRFYLWLAVLTVCFVEAMVESHTVQAIASSGFLRSRHFGLILITSFVRDLLLALLAIGIAAKVLRLRSPENPPYDPC
jgi:hypothetical protein